MVGGVVLSLCLSFGWLGGGLVGLVVIFFVSSIFGLVVVSLSFSVTYRKRENERHKEE